MNVFQEYWQFIFPNVSVNLSISCYVNPSCSLLKRTGRRVMRNSKPAP